MNRSGVQHALFGTLPGRAIVIGVVIRLAVYAVGAAAGGVPVFLNVIDTVASIGLAIGAAYFAYKLIVLGPRRLLWRVRRKLILSSVFIVCDLAAIIERRQDNTDGEFPGLSVALVPANRSCAGNPARTAGSAAVTAIAT